VPLLRHRRAGWPGWRLLQLATGLSNVVLGWPLLAAVLHTGGAAALVVVLTWALARQPRQERPPGFTRPAGAGMSQSA
jgi:cytochrome c oxidase assembly protein subunit 15